MKKEKSTLSGKGQESRIGCRVRRETDFSEQVEGFVGSTVVRVEFTVDEVPRRTLEVSVFTGMLERPRTGGCECPLCGYV